MLCQRAEADENAERGRVGGDWDDRDGDGQRLQRLSRRQHVKTSKGVEAGEAGEKKKAEEVFSVCESI